MRSLILVFLGAGFLTACGVDGAPTPPEPEPESQTVSGVNISGSVGVGVKR